MVHVFRCVFVSVNVVAHAVLPFHVVVNLWSEIRNLYFCFFVFTVGDAMSFSSGTRILVSFFQVRYLDCNGLGRIKIDVKIFPLEVLLLKHNNRVHLERIKAVSYVAEKVVDNSAIVLQIEVVIHLKAGY